MTGRMQELPARQSWWLRALLYVLVGLTFIVGTQGSSSSPRKPDELWAWDVIPQWPAFVGAGFSGRPWSDTGPPGERLRSYGREIPQTPEALDERAGGVPILD